MKNKLNVNIQILYFVLFLKFEEVLRRKWNYSYETQSRLSLILPLPPTHKHGDEDYDDTSAIYIPCQN